MLSPLLRLKRPAQLLKRCHGDILFIFGIAARTVELQHAQRGKHVLGFHFVGLAAAETLRDTTARLPYAIRSKIRS